MHTAYIIVYVTDGQVNWPVLIMTSADRDSGLVAAKNNWNKHGPDCIWVFGNQVLQKRSDGNIRLQSKLSACFQHQSPDMTF